VVETDEQTEGFRQHRYVPPDLACTILLVRHGESAPARPGRPFALRDGHGDPELHEDGWKQSRRLAHRLANESIDAIYVTTLRRTSETAEALATALGLEPIVEPDLREVFLGEWEGGLLRQKAVERDPIVAEIYRQERWDVIPGAEPPEDFLARVLGAIDRIVAAHPGGRVVVVTHGGVIGAIMHAVTESRPFAFAGADNASISEIVVEPYRRVVRRFNDTSHLDSL
jgi:probable phosphoglycerate mutase